MQLIKPNDPMSSLAYSGGSQGISVPVGKIKLEKTFGSSLN